MVIYPYGLGHCRWRLVAIGILNRGIMISHRLRQCVPLSDLEDYDHNIFFSENLTHAP